MTAIERVLQDMVRGARSIDEGWKSEDVRDELFEAAEGMAKKRYASYQRMAKLDWSKEETAE